MVHCIGTLRLGGAEKQLAELIRRLPPDRFEQSLVLLQGGGPLLEDVRAAGCEVIELGWNQRFRKWNPRCWLALARVLGRYVRFLRRRRPRILHAQLYWANNLSVLAGRLARVPVIVTSRLQLSHYKRGRPLLQWIENLANRYTTAVFANSEAVKADALAHERLNPEIVRIIYNGVLLEAFERPDPAPLRRELGIEPGRVVVVAVANLHPYKGHDDLLRAAARLAPRRPELLLLLPGRDQGMRAELERLIDELKLGGQVRLLGERSDIPALLALAEIVVHPSHEEGFSNAILEAMAAGRPVIVSNVGGNPEAVIDGETGLLFPARDAAALAEALERLLADRALRQRLGAAARRRVQTEFSMDRLVADFARWYEELAGRAYHPGGTKTPRS